MDKTITLNPLDDTAAELLQSATIRMAEQLNNHNPNHATILRRMAMNLEKPQHNVGELTVVGGFLLQLAAQQFAAKATDESHAAILYEIAQEITEKIHANNTPKPCD